jgi:hypothetical protein
MLLKIKNSVILCESSVPLCVNFCFTEVRREVTETTEILYRTFERNYFSPDRNAIEAPKIRKKMT